jgi:hypothetical protein
MSRTTAQALAHYKYRPRVNEVLGGLVTKFAGVANKIPS